MLFSALPNGSTRFFTWPWVFYGQLLLLVPIFLLGWALVKQPGSWRRDWWPLAASALAIAVSVLFSHRPAFSFEAALFLFGGLAWTGWVAFKISRVADPHESSLPWIPIARLAGFAFFLPLLAGLIFWVNDWRDATTLDGNWLHSVRILFAWRNRYPFGHWNYTAGFALLALPWFGALLVIERGRWRATWLICAFVGVVMLLSASSRGAVLGALVALAAMACVAVFARKISTKQAVLVALAVLVLAAALLATNSRLRSLLIHPASVFQPSESDVQRIAMLQGGKLLSYQRPWIGHGPGMTPFIYPTVRARLVGGIETSFQLHNGPLQLLVDHGLFGLLCAFMLVLVIGKNALRWLKSPSGTSRTFALASAYSLIGYSIMFVTDYQLNLLAFAAAIGLHAGILLGVPLAKKGPRLRTYRWPGGILLFAVIAAAIFFIPAWRARKVFWSAWETNIPVETLTRLERTVTIAPGNPYYLNQLALKRARLAEATDDPAIVTSLRTQSRTELLRSLEFDPAQEPVHAALGWLWLYEDPKKAEQHFRAALALLPDRDTLHLGLALSLLAQADRRGAVCELALECLVNPPFLASPLWTQEPFLALHSVVAGQLFNDYTFVIDNPNTPAWSKSQLRYATAFARWWLGGRAPDPAELKGALLAQQEFFAQLSLPRESSSTQPQYAWETLDHARQDAANAKHILRSAATPPSNEAVAGALIRIEAKPVDLSSLLRGSAPNAIGVIRRQITRGHYSIMNNVLDGPGYEDLAPRIVDAFTAEYAGELFPAHYALSGPVLLELMKTL
jgi:O-antigen ligase